MNISKDTGPVLTFVVLIDDGSNWDSWYGIDMVVEGFVVSIQSFGTNVGGSISSSGGVCEECETATGEITSSLCGGVSSDNMGSKEFSVGIFSFKEGTSFIKVPTVEEVREVFLLYHMKIIPMAITHVPITVNKARMSLGDNENGSSSSIFSRTLSNNSIDIVGNFNILAFNVSISLVISLAKSDLYHMRKLLTLVYLKL